MNHLRRRASDFDMHAVLVQGDSVRMTWRVDDASDEPRKPLRRDPPPRSKPPAQSSDALRIRLGEELDYLRRMLDALGDQLSSDPILVRRHALALQSLDLVCQILTHVGLVIRSSDPHSAAEDVSTGGLRTRLMRRSAL